MIKHIYIRLLNEGTEVFRPTLGKQVNNFAYEVLLPDGKNELEGEKWEFPPGKTVVCQEQEKEGEKILIAIREWKGEQGRSECSVPT